MTGDAAYCARVQELLFGEGHEIVDGKRAATAQCPGGTGALRVALMQPHIAQGDKWDPAREARTLAVFDGLAAARRGAQLSLWPETSTTRTIAADSKVIPRSFLPGDAGGHHLLGAPVMDGDRFHNSSLLVAPGGRVLGRADKQRLVPFGEGLPGWLRWASGLLPMLNATGLFEPGPARLPLPFETHALGILICYEDYFAGPVRRAARRGADILVVQTNDAWYGGSAMPEQHLVLSRLRAAESGLGVLRSANTGVSAVIDARGRVVDSLPWGSRGALISAWPTARKNPWLPAHPWIHAALVLVPMIGLVGRR
jgi:apolipoprotein N-acyltransferase